MMSINMDKRAVHWLEIGLKLAGYAEEMQERDVAYKRVLYALGAEIGLRPEDVNRAVGMARADIKIELSPKETAPGSGLYKGDTIQNIMATESSDAATEKGRQYVRKMLDYREEG